MELLKNIGIDEHTIKLLKNMQPLYGPIYALRLVELEILKTYIETYLKTRLIQPFKSLTSTSILFDKKSNKSFTCASIIKISTI